MATAQQDAIALLQADHRNVEDLFGQFKQARDADARRAIAEKICMELSIHATIEEEIFYPACKGKVDNSLLRRSYVEHDGAKVMIAELVGSVPDDEFYDAKVTVLSEEIKQHVEEEERPSDGLFAQATKSGLDMTSLGARLMARKEELMSQFMQAGLPPPKTRSFRGHRLDQGYPVDT
jgi:Hemerythrin HHE cation binding domain